MLQSYGKVQAAGQAKNLKGDAGAQLWNGKVYWSVPLPPSPYTLKSRDWRGVYKKCLQNLEPQGVRGQNLENTAVSGAHFPQLRTATAMPSAIMQEIEDERQGQMSHHPE